METMKFSSQENIFSAKPKISISSFENKFLSKSQGVSDVQEGNDQSEASKILSNNSVECLNMSEFYLSSSLTAAQNSRSDSSKYESSIEGALIENRDLRLALTNAEQGWKGALAVAQMLQKRLLEKDMIIKSKEKEIRDIIERYTTLQDSEERIQDLEADVKGIRFLHERTVILLREANDKLAVSINQQERLANENSDLQCQLQQTLGDSSAKRQLAAVNEELQVYKTKTEQIDLELSKSKDRNTGVHLELQSLQNNLQAKEKRIEEYERSFSEIVAYLDQETDHLTRSLDVLAVILEQVVADNHKELDFAARISLESSLEGLHDSNQRATPFYPRWVEGPVKRVGKVSARAHMLATTYQQTRKSSSLSKHHTLTFPKGTVTPICLPSPGASSNNTWDQDPPGTLSGVSLSDEEGNVTPMELARRRSSNHSSRLATKKTQKPTDEETRSITRKSVGELSDLCLQAEENVTLDDPDGSPSVHIRRPWKHTEKEGLSWRSADEQSDAFSCFSDGNVDAYKSQARPSRHSFGDDGPRASDKENHFKNSEGQINQEWIESFTSKLIEKTAAQVIDSIQSSFSNGAPALTNQTPHLTSHSKMHTQIQKLVDAQNRLATNKAQASSPESQDGRSLDGAKDYNSNEEKSFKLNKQAFGKIRRNSIDAGGVARKFQISETKQLARSYNTEKSQKDFQQETASLQNGKFVARAREKYGTAALISSKPPKSKRHDHSHENRIPDSQPLCSRHCPCY